MRPEATPSLGLESWCAKCSLLSLSLPPSLLPPLSLRLSVCLSLSLSLSLSVSPLTALKSIFGCIRRHAFQEALEPGAMFEELREHARSLSLRTHARAHTHTWAERWGFGERAAWTKASCHAFSHVHMLRNAACTACMVENRACGTRQRS